MRTYGLQECLKTYVQTNKYTYMHARATQFQPNTGLCIHMNIHIHIRIYIHVDVHMDVHMDVYVCYVMYIPESVNGMGQIAPGMAARKHVTLRPIGTHS